VSVESLPDVSSEAVPASDPQRAPSFAVLQDVLVRLGEANVAAQLRVSVGTLRRYSAGTAKMNWVTQTRLLGLADELNAKDVAELEAAQRERAQAARKRERTTSGSGSYPRVSPTAVALT
jgi:hypothetical protein